MRHQVVHFALNDTVATQQTKDTTTKVYKCINTQQFMHSK